MRLQKVVLPAPDGAHHGEHLSRRDLEPDVAQHGPLVAVAERDALERDAPLDRVDLDGSVGITDGRSLVDDLEDTRDRASTLLELAVDAGDGREAGADGDAVEQEARQRAQVDGTLDDAMSGEPEQDDERAEAEHEHHRAEEAAIGHEARGHGHHAAQVLPVAVSLPLLTPE